MLEVYKKKVFIHIPLFTKLCESLNELWVVLEGFKRFLFTPPLEGTDSITTCDCMKGEESC